MMRYGQKTKKQPTYRCQCELCWEPPSAQNLKKRERQTCKKELKREVMSQHNNKHDK